MNNGDPRFVDLWAQEEIDDIASGVVSLGKMIGLGLIVVIVVGLAAWWALA
jgi:hypothetical protein